MADQLHVNFLHLYNWNPQRNHLSALNKAASLGIKVAVPISNFFVDPGQDPNAAADIEKIMRSVYVDANGNPSTTPHPAVGMILIANEPENGAIQNSKPGQPEHVAGPGGAGDELDARRRGGHRRDAAAAGGGAVRVLDRQLRRQRQQPGQPRRRGSDPQPPGRDDHRDGRRLRQDPLRRRDQPAEPRQLHVVLDPPVQAERARHAAVVLRAGHGVAKSCLGYQNCTPSEQQQAVFNADQFAATKPNTEDVVLAAPSSSGPTRAGSRAATSSTFGIYKFNGQFRTVPTSGGSYRVDDLVQKPSWNALHDAFNPSPAPAAVVGGSGSGGGATSSASTGTIPTVVPPPAGPATLPDNRFSVRRGATTLNRHRTVATLSFVAPGPGRFSVRELAAGASRAAARKRARRHVHSRRTRARRAGTVRVRLRLTSAGRAALGPPGPAAVAPARRLQARRRHDPRAHRAADGQALVT